jgi:RNA polymerase sigma-70 factor (ECF subfamily)
VSEEQLLLLEAWRAGDQAAGGALLERHYESVLRFFRTKAGDEADDLTQRTFLRCVEATSGYRGDASFGAFVFGIARNIARNVLFEHIRGRKRDAKVDPDFGASSILDLNPRASTVMFKRAEERLLVQALQRMPVDIQMTLELYYWEELSIDEVAEAMGTAPGTIKSRLYRGRALLREELERMPKDSADLVTRAMLGARAAEAGSEIG